jgi:hypothetical protein
MVEFALLLPLLALLLVMAIDFGRVFFGYVGIHNAARIAANEAGYTPDAWSGTGNAAKQADYKQMVANDLNAINCSPLPANDVDGDGFWDLADVPLPTFVNQTGTADPYETGDHAVVQFDCLFKLMTPLASDIVGSNLEIGASAQFVVRGGIIAGVPVGPAPPAPTPTCTTGLTLPLLEGMTVVEARVAWSVAGFVGPFSPTSGPDDSDIVDDQHPSPAADPGDCVAATTSISVDHSPPPTCGPGELIVPSLRTLTVADARTRWYDVGFTGAFTPIVGNDADIVTDQSTSTGRDAGECSAPSTLVIVSYGATPPPNCEAPELIGLSEAAAQTTYQSPPHSFTGTFKATGPSDGTVSSQSLIGGQPYPCDSDITVQLKK